jgi:hypothetical protein
LADKNAKEEYLRINDSDRPVEVQLRLLQLSDDWNNTTDKTLRSTIASEADDVRRLGVNNDSVKKIKNYFESQPDGLKIMNSLSVVDKEKEKAAFQDGVVTEKEWRQMKNISSNLKFKKGTTPPLETYSETGGDFPSDQKSFGTLDAGFGGTIKLGVSKMFLRGGVLAGKLLDLPDASEMLDHYLEGSGDTYNFKNFNKMIKNDPNSGNNYQLALKEAEDAAKSLAVEGETINMVSIMEDKNNGRLKRAGGNEANNWSKSIFNYRTWSSAQVTASRNSNGGLTVNMNFNYNLRDNYRFYGDPTANAFNDYNYQMLHEAGKSREYKVSGEYHYSESW